MSNVAARGPSGVPTLSCEAEQGSGLKGRGEPRERQGSSDAHSPPLTPTIRQRPGQTRSQGGFFKEPFVSAVKGALSLERLHPPGSRKSSGGWYNKYHESLARFND